MIFTYQKNNRYFAQIADGMEELGKAELIALGAQDVKPTFRGVYFCADINTLMRINYTARIITRVFAPLISFDCHSTKYLYKTALTIPWNEIFSLDNTFVISANVSNSKIRHSQYASLVLKDAIVDSFREKCGERPDVARVDADISFNLHISNNRATIYLDTSGGSLHRRGYRQDSVEAPMQETLAAAIINMSQWDGSTPLYDPMCGSGTLLCEALMHFCNIPSGYLRKNFGFTFLPEYNKTLWKSIRKEEGCRIRVLPKGLISGSDASTESIAAAKGNVQRLPHGGSVILKHVRFEDLGNLEDTTIVCNPPYGHRMKTQKDTATLMKAFGDFLKQRCKGSTAYVYFGNRELIKKIGLRTAWKKPLKNGPLDGRLVKFELY